jgi:hypothetical protein
MTYSTPELLFISSAQHLVLDCDSLPDTDCNAPDGVEGGSYCGELW